MTASSVSWVIAVAYHFQKVISHKWIHYIFSFQEDERQSRAKQAVMYILFSQVIYPASVQSLSGFVTDTHCKATSNSIRSLFDVPYSSDTLN